MVLLFQQFRETPRPSKEPVLQRSAHLTHFQRRCFSWHGGPGGTWSGPLGEPYSKHIELKWTDIGEISKSTHDTHIFFFTYVAVVVARGGAKVALGLHYKTFFIYGTCMRRAPGPPVRACSVQKSCKSGALFQRPHLNLQTSHCTLHTPHFPLHTPPFISSHLGSSQLWWKWHFVLQRSDSTLHLHISFHLVLSAISSRHLISPYISFFTCWPPYRWFTSLKLRFFPSLQNYQRGFPHFPRWGPPRYRRCTSSLPPSPLSFRVRLDPATPSAASPGKVMAGCQSITTSHSCLKKVPSV